MPIDFAQLMQALLMMALPAIFAITFHEAAHGYVAHKLGDDTAWQMGRVTFNLPREEKIENFKNNFVIP